MQYRRAQEALAQRDYLEALRKYENEMRNLEQMQNDLLISAEIRTSKKTQGGDVGKYLISVDEFILGQKHRIDRQKQVVSGLSKIVDEKHQILMESARNYRVIVKLKEKRRDEFDQEILRTELKRADDMVVMRFNRRGGT